MSQTTQRYTTVRVTFADGHRCYVTNADPELVRYGSYARSTLFETPEAAQVMADAVAAELENGATVEVVPEGK